MKLLAGVVIAAAVWVVTSFRRLPPPDPWWFDALHDDEFFERVDHSGRLRP